MVFSLVLTSVFASGSSESSSGTAAAAEITAEDLKNANVTLEFWHAQTGENGVAMDMVVDLFNQTNEYGITVNATCQGGYSDTHNKVVSALSAGTAPNVSQAYNNNMMTYMPSGKLMDLTDYLTDDFGITAEELADVVPSYLEENRAFPDGRTYATSLGKSTEVMFYNKTFFDEHGLEVPTTYEELADVAKQISEITGRPSVGFDSMDNLGIYARSTSVPSTQILRATSTSSMRTILMRQWSSTAGGRRESRKATSAQQVRISTAQVLSATAQSLPISDQAQAHHTFSLTDLNAVSPMLL